MDKKATKIADRRVRETPLQFILIDKGVLNPAKNRRMMCVFPLKYKGDPEMHFKCKNK